MQDEEDLVMPPSFQLPQAPIMYAEATASDNVTTLMIDYT
jgi:hypothetical protein